jgi:hypothetical protein
MEYSVVRKNKNKPQNVSFLRSVLGVVLYNQINWSLLQTKNVGVVTKCQLNLTQYENRM